MDIARASIALALIWACVACYALSVHSRTPGLIEQVVMDSQMAGFVDPNHPNDRSEQHHIPSSPIDGMLQSSYDEDEDEYYDERGRRDTPDHRRRRHDYDYDEGEEQSFVLRKPVKVIKTEAGEMRMLPHGVNNELAKHRIGLGFLIMEPKALLLPQYIDASCLFLVHTGRARLSWVQKGDLQETDLEVGDVFKIEGGTVFYIFNIDEGQRLSIFSIFDTSLVYNAEMLHNFFVTGGRDPSSVLSGFDEDVLATAFKVTPEEVRDIVSSQTEGPIIYPTERNVSRAGRLSLMQKFSKYIEFPSIFTKDSKMKPFNILKKKSDFSNDYGSTVTVNEDDYEMLKAIDKGVFSVRLKAGAVLAPHWNPSGMEIGLVTKGEGEIQIAFANGSAAATERVQEGTVFFVPRNYPMCQIASRSGPLEFMGFTTSGRPNRPQFLAGANSVLKAVDPNILAQAFNMPPDDVQAFFDAQTESVILPGLAEPEKREPEERGGKAPSKRAPSKREGGKGTGKEGI